MLRCQRKIHACWCSETPLLCRCSCNKYVFWPSVTSTNTTAVQTCLLVEWCARWVLAGPLPLNQYACRSFTTQSVYLLIFNHSFLHACWCCVSLFAILACMISHDQPCLLVWSLTIGHAFWFDASLSAMPSDVLSHHRPRLLVWSLIINHAHWCGASLQTTSAGQLPLQQTFLLVECRWKDGYKSGATCTEVSSHQTCLLNLAQNYNASLKLRTT